MKAVLARAAPAARTPLPAGGAALALALAAFAAVWLWHLGATSLVPPVDDIEQLVWAQHLAWGYDKHPPLPTWLIAGPIALFGATRATVGAMGAATTLAALAVFWALLRRLRGTAWAWTALGAALCVTYYNGRLDYYNHEVVLLLANNACAALAWQAHRTRRRGWWAALGLGLGLGALAKYQIAVTAAAALVFFAAVGDLADARQRRGLWLAAAVAAAVFAPHLAWLAGHGFAPVHYAMRSSLGAALPLATRARDAAVWLADQTLNRGLPALLFLLACAVSAAPGTAGARRRGTPPPADAAQRLVLAWGLTPLAFMPLTGLLAGADLQLHWGMPFLPWTVAALMERAAPAAGWPAVRPLAAIAAFVGLQALLLGESWLTSPFGPPACRMAHWRNVDAALLAARIGPPARAALGGPVTLVVGPPPWAGTLGLALPERPAVRIEKQPGVALGGTADPAAGRCGVLRIAPLAALPGGTPLGPPFDRLAWRAEPRAAGPAAGCP